MPMKMAASAIVSPYHRDPLLLKLKPSDTIAKPTARPTRPLKPADSPPSVADARRSVEANSKTSRRRSASDPSSPSPESPLGVLKRKMQFRQRLSSRVFGDNLTPGVNYLTYYDVTLRTEDIVALKDDWLTDNNISFWQEWLEREVLPKYPEARIILMRPSLTFLLMQALDLKGASNALPDLRKVTHIFLPVNDSRARDKADGGSHWSLLLVSCIDGVAFHYDSLGGSNFLEAQKCADRIGKVIGQALRFHQMEDSPQQENGNDCGVYVCILMRHLLIKRLLNANANEKVSMSMANKLIDAKGGRKEMMKIIESLRKEGERRRSASPYARGRAHDGAPRID
ncbi:hypothetical protein B0T14DRAFT_505059 [Immersiella caudata]|uniref:Ubiquitin-like protease family profile domain-containing protein n=1 Tax=Immersiella caudata TaxID=314043 RepID=A0AA40CBL9_9PEZI|nr:hypothetical protein B0T14DRAFT_505059 [Immersiella caudata]